MRLRIAEWLGHHLPFAWAPRWVNNVVAAWMWATPGFDVPQINLPRPFEFDRMYKIEMLYASDGRLRVWIDGHPTHDMTWRPGLESWGVRLEPQS